MTARELIDEALRDVRVVICERCKGIGEIGLASLPATCPACRGSGKTTTNELELHDA